MFRRLGSSAAAFQVLLQLTAIAFCRSEGSAQNLAVDTLAPLDATKPALAATSSESQRTARATYTAGVAAFQRGAYAEAATLFARADDLVSSPNAKLMLGRCLRQLGRPTEAYRALDASVKQSEASDLLRYARSRAAALAELELVREQIGLLTVYVHAGRGPAYLHVSGQPVPRSDWRTPLPVRPGAVKLSLETLPGVIEHREVEILAGQAATVVMGTPADDASTFALGSARRAPVLQADAGRSSASSLRVASYVVGGAGAAGLIAFGVLGALSKAAFDELEANCDKTRCDPELESVAERGEVFQASANVALAVGAAALGIGIGLFAISGDEETPPDRRNVISVTPLGVSLRGEL